MADAAALANRADLALGNALVMPGGRTLSASDGKTMLEPRVMQVLLRLADAQGAVVTRDALIDSCWGGQVVGDDAINRAISELRRAARACGADFVVETVPKIGYRLTAATAQTAVPTHAADLPTQPWGTRRAWLAGSAALFLGVSAGTIGWWRLAAPDPRPDPRVTERIARARDALRDELPDSTQQGIGFLQEAAAIAPRDPLVWGLTALAWRNASEFAPPTQVASAVTASKGAARRALALDTAQAEALAALALLPPIFGDWYAAERRLDDVLSVHADQRDALEGLGILYFSVGRSRDGAAISGRLAAADPLSPIYQYRHAYRQWAVGDLAGADRTIDRALQLWPAHPAVRYCRFVLFALTGRRAAARAMLAGGDTPAPFPPPVLASWKQTLSALDSGRPADRRPAIDANLAIARAGMGNATNAILALSALGALNEAFVVIDGYLADKGALATSVAAAPGQRTVNDQRWRKTMMLFVPATAPLRMDPRFAEVAAVTGMADYWRRSGVRPDYQAGLG